LRTEQWKTTKKNLNPCRYFNSEFANYKAGVLTTSNQSTVRRTEQYHRGAGKEVAWIQEVSGTPVKAGFVNYKLQTQKYSDRILTGTKHL